jgi:hypothetical protein
VNTNPEAVFNKTTYYILVTYEVRVFVLDKLFQSSLMIASEARSFPRVERLKGASLR